MIGHTQAQKTILLTIDLSKASRRDFLAGFIESENAIGDWNVRIVQMADGVPATADASSIAETADGLLVVDAPSDDAFARILNRPGLPAVIVGSSNERARRRSDNTVYLRIDDRKIGRFAAERLLELGRFNAAAFLTDASRHAWSDLRRLGFLDGMAAAKCPVKICDLTDRKALPAILKTSPRPLALFAASDRMALAALSEIPNAAREIPSRIALLGVDDDRLICEAARPRLSSIRPDHRREGMLAARELASLLAARKTRKCRHVLCDRMSLVTRETTAALAPAAGLVDAAQAYIRENAVNGLTPDDVALRLRISRRLLDLRFREFTDTSVARMIRDAKIAAVKREIERTRDTLVEIARRCGFKNANHLKNAFKAETGVTMRAWRASHATHAVRGVQP